MNQNHTCPPFCVSAHTESPDITPVHFDRATDILTEDGPIRVDLQQLADETTATVYVADKPCTPAQARQLVDAITARLEILAAVAR